MTAAALFADAAAGAVVVNESRAGLSAGEVLWGCGGTATLRRSLI
jgi:hypothetical protein